MTKAKGLVIFVGFIVGCIAGFVIYKRYQPPPRIFISEENRAFIEKQWRPIRLAQADLEDALAAYKHEHGDFPTSLAELNLTNLPNGVSTSYLGCFEYTAVNQGYRISAQMGGIGVQLASHGDFHKIEPVSPNSPASRANLMPGDFVLRVDEGEVAKLDDLMLAVQGPPGTTVMLTVKRASSDKIETLNLTREPLGSLWGQRAR